jgi:cytochrome P450
MTTLTSTWTEGDGACPASTLGRAYRPLEHDGFYDFIAKAQAEEPVFFSEAIRYWVVTRRADVLAVLADPDSFSAAITLAPVHPFPPEVVAALRDGGFSFQPTLVNSDASVHSRLRPKAQRFLNAKRYATYADRIRAIVRDHIAAIGEAPRVDLVAALTYEVPAKVLALLLGIEDISPRQIKVWADHRLGMTFGVLEGDELAEAARQLLDYWKYCERLVADRQDNPRDDYASMLLDLRGGDDGVLTITDVVGLVFGVMVAGHETTTNAAGNLIHALLTDRDQWERLKADPTLIPNAVEEGLRHSSSVVNWRRRTTRPVTVGGVDIPEGANVLISLAGANNDPEVFENPRSFDVGRENVKDHVAFGKGRHFCLARLEITIILEELLAAFPDMTLAPGFQPAWVPTVTFRGPLSLEVLPRGGAMTTGEPA